MNKNLKLIRDLVDASDGCSNDHVLRRAAFALSNVEDAVQALNSMRAVLEVTPRTVDSIPMVDAHQAYVELLDTAVKAIREALER